MSDPLSRIDDWDVDTLAVGVSDATSTLAARGPTGQVLEMASVTKPLSAYGVLVAVRDGAVHLDEPAGPTADDGATVRHLLAHAGGLPFEDDAPTQTPGRRRVYSNWGYEVLGDLVAERVGLPFAEHLEVELFDPLAMHDTRLHGSPGAGARGSVDDLLAFVREPQRRLGAEVAAAGDEHPHQASSRSTASDRSGHPCFAHVPKGRSLSRAHPMPASGSTQRNEPDWPKWPKVDGERASPVQWGDLASLSSKPSPQSLGCWRP